MKKFLILLILSSSLFASDECNQRKMYLEEILANLKNAAVDLNLIKPEKYISYSLICEKDEFLAYTVTPRIFISEMLFEVFDYEDEVASVVAHELGHVILNHREAFITKKESVKREKKADEIGIKIHAQAGYHKDATAQAFKKVLKTKKLLGRFFYHFSSNGHPMPILRKRQFKKYSEKIPHYGNSWTNLKL